MATLVHHSWMSWFLSIKNFAITVWVWATAATARCRLPLQGIGIAALLLAIVVLLLAFADTWAPPNSPFCFASFSKSQFPKWLGCTMAAHESLAAGLIAAAGALLAAWVAWHAIMRQINAEADVAYEAMQIQLQPMILMLNQYWRIVDASIRNKKWRQNGAVLLQTLPGPKDFLQRIGTEDLARKLDPIRRWYFLKFMESLSWVEQRMQVASDEPLWFENLRTMLSYCDFYLRKFDPEAAKLFWPRKKSALDHRTMAEHSEPLIARFEKSGNM